MRILRIGAIIACTALICSCTFLNNIINPPKASNTSDVWVLWKSGAIVTEIDSTDSVRITVACDSLDTVWIQTQPYSLGQLVFFGLPRGITVVVRAEGLRRPRAVVCAGTIDTLVLSNKEYDVQILPELLSPLPPDSLVADGRPPTAVYLTWLDRSNNETHFVVERKVLGGAFDSIAGVRRNMHDFLDTGLALSTVYVYRVYARNAVGASEPTDTVIDSTSIPCDASPYELDTFAVRAILDSNQMTSLPVASVCRIGSYGGTARITELLLNRSVLRGDTLRRIPADIARLNGLSVLRLDSNLVAALPGQICSLSALVRLDASCNRITALPAAIGRLKSLKWLYLRDNALTTLPDGVGALDSLQVLGLERNKLTALPDTLANLAAITNITFDGNLICALSARIRDWLTAKYLYDPDWRSGQSCP